MARHGFNTLWQQQSPASAVALLDFYMQKGSQCFLTLWTPLHHVQGRASFLLLLCPGRRGAKGAAAMF